MKITKKTFAQGVSKAIPILGGVISGGLTYASMKPMGNRLRKTLYDVVDGYSNEDFSRDYDDVKKEIIDITDEVIEEQNNEQYNEETESIRNEPFSAADEIMKFKQLLDIGVITQEEFDVKKAELLK